MLRYTYYSSAISSAGYVSFFDTYLKDFKRVVCLKNITSKEKKMLFSTAREILDKHNITYDIIPRAGYSDEIDAIVVAKLSSVIADEYLFADNPPLYADTIDFYENINLDFDIRQKLHTISDKCNRLRRKIFSHLADAKTIHDRWEKVYISNMDFDALRLSSDKLCDNIFANIEAEKTNKIPSDTERFFGSLLPRGNVNYIDELTSDITKRVFVKGRPGTGKSTLLKKIRAKAHELGFDTESYYCAFDTSSLDMLVIRDIDFCIFDSTPPHEKFPQKDTDAVFDIYDIAVEADTDEKYSDELMHIASSYNSSVKKAKECMYSLSIERKACDRLITLDADKQKALIERTLSISGINKIK